MSTAPCRDCGHQISKAAKACPKCGKPQAARTSPIAWIAAVLLVLWGLSAVFGDGDKPSASARSAHDFTVRYVHTTVNVRAGAGTDAKVIGQVSRGGSVQLKGSTGNWSQVVAPGIGDGFIYTELLKVLPIPPIEVASWNWRTDRDFGTDGAVIWNVELRNNTSQYIESARVELTTYDSKGQLITSAARYVNGLAPGGTAATKGYATYFGTEAKASIRIVP